MEIKVIVVLLAVCLLVSFFIISFVSADTLYYSPSCPHCENVMPYIHLIPNIKLCDVNNPISRDIAGVPTLILDDGAMISGDTPIINYILTQPSYSKNPTINDKEVGTKTINHIVYEVWEDVNGNVFLGRDIASN